MSFQVDEKEVILLGDMTTHGGKVISASSDLEHKGIKVARVGDMVACPRCKGVFPIIQGAPATFDLFANIARHGDKVACGASLISGSLGAGGSGDSDFVAAQISTSKKRGTPSPLINSPKSKVEAFNAIPESELRKLEQQFVKAFRESFIHTPEGLKMQEQGGWIVKNKDGRYSLERIPATGPITNNVKELEFAFPKKIPPNAIGTFHTHCSPYEALWPSEDDIDISGGMGLPGIVMGPDTRNRSANGRPKIGLQPYDWTFPKDPPSY